MLLIIILCTCHLMQAQNRERVIDSLNNLLQQSKVDTNRARLLIMIGDRYEQRNDSIAIDYYYKAIDLSLELDYAWGEAVARQYLADVYLRHNKYDSSSLHLTRVMDLSEKLKDNKRIGVAANSIALINHHTGELENALQFYLMAAQHFEKLDASQRILLISCYTNIGGVFFDLGQHEKSLQYMKQAYAIAIEIKNDVEIAYAACELGASLQKNGNAKEAKQYIERAVTIANKEDDLLLKTIAWQGLGTVHLQEQNYNDALAAFNQALSIANQYGDTSRIALLLGYTGRAQYWLKNYPAAEQNLMTALRYYTNIQDLTGLSKIYEALYNLETTKGNYNYMEIGRASCRERV